MCVYMCVFWYVQECMCDGRHRIDTAMDIDTTIKNEKDQFTLRTGSSSSKELGLWLWSTGDPPTSPPRSLSGVPASSITVAPLLPPPLPPAEEKLAQECRAMGVAAAANQTRPARNRGCRKLRVALCPPPAFDFCQRYIICLCCLLTIHTYMCTYAHTQNTTHTHTQHIHTFSHICIVSPISCTLFLSPSLRNLVHCLPSSLSICPSSRKELQIFEFRPHLR